MLIVKTEALPISPSIKQEVNNASTALQLSPTNTLNPNPSALRLSSFLLNSAPFFFILLWCFMNAPSDQRANVIYSASGERAQNSDTVTNQREEQLTSNCIVNISQTHYMHYLFGLFFFMLKLNDWFHIAYIATWMWYDCIRGKLGVSLCCVFGNIASCPDYRDYNSAILLCCCD